MTTQNRTTTPRQTFTAEEFLRLALSYAEDEYNAGCVLPARKVSRSKSKVCSPNSRTA